MLWEENDGILTLLFEFVLAQIIVEIWVLCSLICHRIRLLLLRLRNLQGLGRTLLENGSSLIVYFLENRRLQEFSASFCLCFWLFEVELLCDVKCLLLFVLGQTILYESTDTSTFPVNYNLVLRFSETYFLFTNIVWDTMLVLLWVPSKCCLMEVCIWSTNSEISMVSPLD